MMQALLQIILVAATIITTTCVNYIDHISTNGNNAALLVDDTITSSDTTTSLLMQGDGNLVLYYTDNSQTTALWSSDTCCDSTGFWANLELDGNLVVYNANGDNEEWASNTATNGDTTQKHLVVSNQCVYLLSDDMNVLWSAPSSGCTLYPTYYLIYDAINTYDWDSAESYCQTHYSSHLATATTDEEMQQLIDLRTLSGHTSNTFWIGLNDQETEGTWNWISGHSCDYATNSNCANDDHWNDGEPNDYGNGEDCAHLLGTTTDRDLILNDASCTMPLNGFFCDTTQVYNLVFDATNTFDWDSAELYCQTHYYSSHLATATTHAEMQKLIDLRSAAGYNDYRFWIGLNDKHSEGTWIWASGHNCDYATNSDCANDDHWDDGEPNDYGEDEDCAHLWESRTDRDLILNDASCTQTYHGFFCDEAMSTYHLVYDAINTYDWNSAESYCQTHYSSHLATATTDEEMQELIDLRAYSGYTSDKFWIGLNDQETEGTWNWISGHSCDYATNSNCANDDHWDDGEPNDYGNGEDCAFLWGETTDRDLILNDASCTKPLNGFFCDEAAPTTSPTKSPTKAPTKSPTKVPTKSPTKVPTTFPTKAPTKSPTKTPTKTPTKAPTKTPTNAPTAQDYILVYSDDRYTWNEAERICKTYYASHLATVANDNEMQELINLRDAAGYLSKNFWIGLNDINTEGTWLWVNGDQSCNGDCATIDYWKDGEPAADDCGYMHQDSTDLNDILKALDCSTPIGGFFCDSEGVYSSDLQYIFGDNGAEKTWDDAESWCVENGGHLASIVNEDDLVNFDKQIVEDLVNQAFIGLNDRTEEGKYEWIDERDCEITTDLCSALWAEGKPDNANTEEEDCVKYHKRLNGINDIKCSKSLQFICNNPNYIPTPRPTLAPTVQTNNPSKAPTHTTPAPTRRPTAGYTTTAGVGSILPRFQVSKEFVEAMVIVFLVALVINIVLFSIWKQRGTKSRNVEHFDCDSDSNSEWIFDPTKFDQ